jgi:3',5'-cyclic AMP phosphodiesterase CpdA
MARLLHLSDIHFGGENTEATAAALRFAEADCPDLILVTGDLTLNGLPREFKAAQGWLRNLPTPWLATPGNHDTPYWNLALRALTPFARYGRWIGPAFGEQAAAEGVVVQTVNTARGAQPRLDWSKGAIALEVCRRTVDRFSVAPPAALRVVACHHPLIEAIGAPVTGGVYRGGEAAAILANGGVDAILTGHVHNPFASSLPCADGKTYAIGAGTLSVRLRGTPPSFNRICTTVDTLTVEAMAWTGSHFEPFRTWALPRRIRHENGAP